MKTGKTLALIICCAGLMCGCASEQRSARGGLMSPASITAPIPILGNTGQYLCPYAQDGRQTSWLEAALKSSPAGAAASAPGLEPPVRPGTGSEGAPPPLPPEDMRTKKRDLGSTPAQDAEKQQAAAARAGGFDAIRAHSNLSFSSADDLCVYLYAKYSRTPNYSQVYAYLSTLYPDLGQRCPAALRRASQPKDGGHGPGDGGPGDGPGGGPGGGGPGGMGGGMGGGTF
jgi:hypothetical protein